MIRDLPNDFLHKLQAAWGYNQGLNRLPGKYVVYDGPTRLEFPTVNYADLPGHLLACWHHTNVGGRDLCSHFTGGSFASMALGPTPWGNGVQAVQPWTVYAVRTPRLDDKFARLLNGFPDPTLDELLSMYSHSCGQDYADRIRQVVKDNHFPEWHVVLHEGRAPGYVGNCEGCTYLVPLDSDFVMRQETEPWHRLCNMTRKRLTRKFRRILERRREGVA